MEVFLPYGIFLLVSCLLGFLCDTYNYNRTLLFFTFAVVCIFWSIRYMIGYDYAGYIIIFDAIRAGDNSYVEPGYLLLNKLFSYSPSGFLGAITIMTVATYYFLFRIFIREQALGWGLLFSMLFHLQFMFSNQIRQGFVLIVFIFIIPLLEEKKYIRFSLIVLVLTLMHTSAIALLLTIPISRIKISKWIWLGAVVSSYLLYLAGFFKILGTVVIRILPEYGTGLYDQLEGDFYSMQGFSSLMLFWTLVSIFLLLYSEKINRPVMMNIYLSGIILYSIFFEYFLLVRVIYYFFYLSVPLAAILCVKERGWIRISFVSTCLLAFYLMCASLSGMHGAYPYQTLLDYPGYKRYQMIKNM